MKTVVSRAFLMLMLGCALWGQATASASKDGLDCFERLILPGYPELARLARLEGRAEVSFVVAMGGAVDRLIVTGVSDLLRKEVSRQIGRSILREECKGRTVKLRIHFAITGAPTEEYPVPKVSFAWPADFFVTVHPAVPMP